MTGMMKLIKNGKETLNNIFNQKYLNNHHVVFAKITL